MKKHHFFSFFLVLFCLSLFALPCLAANDLADGQDTDSDIMAEFMDDYGQEMSVETDHAVSDPLYHVNRFFYECNDFFYGCLLKPGAKTYMAITPAGLRTCISHFFYNLMFPVRFVNHGLQGKVKQSAREAGVFLINSTLGCLGFFQVAQDKFCMDSHGEDLGQTFGKWGMGNGCYLVLPFLGPSTLRDALGRAGDFFLTPVNYVSPWEARWGAVGLEKINWTSFHTADYEALKSAALDPYAAMKHAYLQNREAELKK